MEVTFNLAGLRKLILSSIFNFKLTVMHIKYWFLHIKHVEGGETSYLTNIGNFNITVPYDM